MELTTDLKKGQLVRSKSGRDKGRVFLILDILDDKNIFITDGSLRGVERPKKKKVIHLEVTKKVFEDFYDEKLPFQMNNKKIRDIIKTYNKTQEKIKGGL